MADPPPPTTRVVVTGLGILSPLGRDVEEFWANLTAGVAAVRPATGAELGGVPGAYAGEIPDAWLPAAAPGVDRDTTLAVAAASEALRRSGLTGFPAERAGIVLGKCQATPPAASGACPPFHRVCDIVADRLGLAGPRIVISTACAAGGNAVGAGLDLIRAGAADIVLAGGVDVLLRATLAGFASLKALSPVATSPYSRSDGLSLGEAAAFLVLESAGHAARRGAPVLAEVAGYGLSADAYHATSPDPSGRGAVTAMRRALRHAALGPGDVSYVNGHGTGTPANDRMEWRAMRSLFGASVGAIPISSTKSAIGHTLGAAGAVEAVASVLAVAHDAVPPTTNVTAPPPDGLDIVPGAGRAVRVDVALSNSYAFGGNNCSVVLVKDRATPLGDPRSGRRVVITGIGAVGGDLAGLDQWRDALLTGRSSIGPLRSFDGTAHGCGFGVEAAAPHGRPLAAAGLWRHLDPFGRQVLAAAVGAWDDAGLHGQRGGREDVGLVFATGYGPVRSSSQVAAVTAAGAVPNAVDFANSVANAAPGAVCQALNLRGPTTTVSSGGVSAVIALDIAVTLIGDGRADRIVVIAADDLCELILRERSTQEPLAADGVVRPYDVHRSGPVLGAAAVALVLEAADVAAGRDATARCEVSAVQHTGCRAGGDGAAAFELVLRRALAQGGQAGVSFCAGAGSGARHDVDELRALDAVLGRDVLLSAPAALFGECAAASGGINLLVAALAVSEGLLPATANLDHPSPGFSVRHLTRTRTDLPVRQALANAVSPGSAYGTALLSAMPGSRQP